ncbi:MAG TPA: hypothetical protein VF478_06635 [Anaerolineae bacterium]
MTTDKINPAAEEPSTVMTRRQLLTTAAAGGAGLAVSALGGAAVGSLMTRAEYEVELVKLRALVALYEQLERVGLDAILQTGLNIVRGALDGVKGSVNLLRSGITAVETALTNFQKLLDSLRSASTGAGQVLDDLTLKFKAAEGVIVAVLGTALPLAESIAGFFNALLQKIPFGIGDDIHRAVDALVALVRAIPTVVDAVTKQLIQPMRDAFFPPSGDPTVKAGLIDPIVKNVLEPAKKQLNDIDKLATSWEKDLTTPVQAALTERQKIRDQIADYKKQQGMA